MLEQQVVSNLSRRAALRIFGAAARMLLVAACQASAPANPPIAAPVPKPTSPAAAAQPTAAAAPTTLPAAANDRAAKAGFIPVGVGPANTALLSAPKGQPHSGGTLQIGNLGDLPNADGHWINGQNVFYAADDRLVDLDASLQPHSSLAESWDNSADFTQITSHLRKVTWHSGREFTAEDIALNYNRIKSDSKINGGIKANFFVPLGSIETPDKYTVVLKATQPLASDIQRAVMDQHPRSAGATRAKQTRRYRTGLPECAANLAAGSGEDRRHVDPEIH